MRNQTGRTSIAWSAFVLAVGMGCVEAGSGSGLVIVQNQVPASTMGGGCVVPVARTELVRLRGVLDVGLDGDYPYLLFPLVKSQMPSFATGGPDQNRVVVERFEVKIEPPPTITQVAWTPDCPPRFDYPTPIFLDPGDEASANVPVVRSCHSGLLRTLFQAGTLNPAAPDSTLFRTIVRARGRHGSNEIVSEPFDFPIHVCFGCLQEGFPNYPLCSQVVTNPFPGNACNPAQDANIQCCANDAMATDIVCPAPSMKKP